jgi:hypothetical protein
MLWPALAGTEVAMGMRLHEQSMDVLMAEHRALDSQVRAFSKRPYLTQAEQLEESLLKKRRLLAKDQMVALERVR